MSLRGVVRGVVRGVLGGVLSRSEKLESSRQYAGAACFATALCPLCACRRSGTRRFSPRRTAPLSRRRPTSSTCPLGRPDPDPNPNPNLNPNPNPNLNPNPNPSQACQLLKDPCNLHCSPAVCVRDGLCEWAEQKSWCEAANFTVTVVPDRLSGPVESALRCNPTLYVKGAR